MAEDSPPNRCKQYFFHAHASKLLQQLNETRHLPHLCDGTVTFGERTIPVQKNILSSASPYFKAFFDYDSQMSNESSKHQSNGTSVVSLENMGISEETFQVILDFMYTSKVELNAENIQNVLQASDQLLMTDLKRLCCKFLDTCINIQNCIGIFDFTSQLSCTWSHINVSQFLDTNFREVSNHQEFLELDASRVEQFLSRRTLNVESEDEIVEIILRWFDFSPNTRKEKALALFRSVVLAKQTSDELLVKLKNIAEFGEEFVEVLKSLRIEQENSSVIHRGYTRVLVACGGEGETLAGDDTEVKDYTRCVRVYDGPYNKQDCWVDLAPMNTVRTDHGIVEVAGCLYAAGGRDETSRILNSCEKYDPLTNKWTYVARMNHARKGFGLVAIENYIYAIGGSNDLTDPLTSMEVLDMFTDKWKPLPDMIVKKAFASHAVAGKKIFVIGGGVVEKYYDSVEVFDTEYQTWYTIAPLRERRCFAQAVSVNSDIYVFGGLRRIECPSAAHSGNNLKLCRSEYYSSRLDTWRPQSSYFLEYGYCVETSGTSVNGAVSEGDRLLVVGELNMENEWQAVRTYNRITNQWECLVRVAPPRQQRYPCCGLNIPTHIFHQLLWDQQKLQTTDILKKK